MSSQGLLFFGSYFLIIRVSDSNQLALFRQRSVHPVECDGSVGKWTRPTIGIAPHCLSVPVQPFVSGNIGLQSPQSMVCLFFHRLLANPLQMAFRDQADPVFNP
jgi:hypothetical protein